MKTFVRLGLVVTSLLAFSTAVDILQLWHDTCLGSRLIESLSVDEPQGPGGRLGISCKDEMNRRVPWYIVYKLPKVQQHEAPYVAQGRAYVYLHPEFLGLKMKWRLSNKAIDDVDSFLGNTLRQRSISLWASYNDQFPESTTPGGAHSKGVIMFHASTRTAVWLVHSVPKMPVDSGFRFYPETGFNNGQTMMCINMPISTMLEVVRRLHKIQPHVQFRSRMAPHLIQAALSDVRDQNLFLDLGNNPLPYDNNFVETMRIVQPQQQQIFRAFFKPPDNNIDIYSEYLAPDHGSHMQVQSWFRGRGGRMCRVVNNHQAGFYNRFACVQDVKTVKILAEDCQGNNVTIEFNSSKDHSKWAVTEEVAEPWVCVADLNRMVSQKFRGGSALCILHPDVWTVFNRTVGSLVQGDVPPPAPGDGNHDPSDLRV